MKIVADEMHRNLKIFKIIIIHGFLILLIIFSGCAHYDYALFKEGRELFEKQEYGQAAEKFNKIKQDYPQSNISELAEEYLKKTEDVIRKKESPLQKGAIQEKKLPGIEEKVLGPEIKPEKLLSNVFIDTDIKEIIRNLSAETGINLITDDTIQGVLSVRYENQPLEKVLRY